MSSEVLLGGQGRLFLACGAVARSIVLLAFFVAAPVSTAGAQKGVRTTSSADFDFKGIETYSWKSRPERAQTALKDGDPLDQAIRRGTDQILQKAGRRRVEQSGDLELTYEGVIVDTFMTPDRFEAVDSVNPGAIAGPGGRSLQQGALVILARDPESDKTVWSGAARKNLGTTIAVVDSPSLRRKAESLAKKIAKAFPR